MSLEKDWVNGLKKEVVIPKEVQDKANMAYDKIRQQAKEERVGRGTGGRRRKWTPKKAIVVAAVAVLACTTITVGAVTISKWNDNFKQKHGTKIEGALQEQLVADGVTTAVDQEQTVNGITIKAVQMISGGSDAYLMFELTSDKELPGPREIEDGFIPMKFKKVTLKGANGEEIICGEPTFSLGSNGEYFFEVVVSPKGDGDRVNGTDVTVSFQDLLEDNLVAHDWTLLHEGVWDFSLALPEKDSNIAYEVDQEIGQYGVRVKKLELSPISLAVYYDNWSDMEEGVAAAYAAAGITIGEEIDTTGITIHNELEPSKNQYLNEHPFTEPVVPMAFTMKDGSVVYLDELGFGDWSEDRYTEHAQGLRGHWCFKGFEQVVDVEKIEGVLFGGNTNETVNDLGRLVFRPAREDMVEVKLK